MEGNGPLSSCTQSFGISQPSKAKQQLWAAEEVGLGGEERMEAVEQKEKKEKKGELGFPILTQILPDCP